MGILNICSLFRWRFVANYNKHAADNVYISFSELIISVTIEFVELFLFCLFVFAAFVSCTVICGTLEDSTSKDDLRPWESKEMIFTVYYSEYL